MSLHFGWFGLRTPYPPLNLWLTLVVLLHAIASPWLHGRRGECAPSPLQPLRALGWVSVWGLLAVLGFLAIWTPTAWFGFDPMFEPVARVERGWRRVEAIRVNPAAFRPYHIRVMWVAPLVPRVLELWVHLHTERRAADVQMQWSDGELVLDFGPARPSLAPRVHRIRPW